MSGKGLQSPLPQFCFAALSTPASGSPVISRAPLVLSDFSQPSFLGIPRLLATPSRRAWKEWGREPAHLCPSRKFHRPENR